VKWLVAIGVLAACETTPYVTTPLDGSIACGMDACGGGDVCIEQYVAGRVPNPTRCFSPPDGCYIFTCDGENCAPCMRAQCEPFVIGIVGRNVYCEEGQ
jgi:hypothetical protein